MYVLAVSRQPTVYNMSFHLGFKVEQSATETGSSRVNIAASVLSVHSLITDAITSAADAVFKYHIKKKDNIFCVNLPLMAISQHAACTSKEKSVSNHTV